MTAIRQRTSRLMPVSVRRNGGARHRGGPHRSSSGGRVARSTRDAACSAVADGVGPGRDGALVVAAALAVEEAAVGAAEELVAAVAAVEVVDAAVAPDVVVAALAVDRVDARAAVEVVGVAHDRVAVDRV